MSAVNWPEGLNNKAFGVTFGYVDNVQTQEYDSGRVVSYAKNTRVLRKYSVSFRWSKEEKKLFDFWYRVTLGGGAGTFMFPSFEDGTTSTEYRISSIPDGSGLKFKEYKMEFTEV